MIFSYLFLQLLKIVVFLCIPAHAIITNLQVKTLNQHNTLKNKTALSKLIIVALIYSLYSFAECLDFSTQTCLWYLIALVAAALYLKATGKTNLGIQKAFAFIDNLKKKTN